jgi:hypothetical protein
MVSAIAALALVSAVWLGLHTYELIRWREARAESRSILASPRAISNPGKEESDVQDLTSSYAVRPVDP